MNNFQLKILACILMVIDHVGVVFFPNIIIYRIVGRLSFPIFAFLLTEGYFYTKNIKNYLIRLFIFSLIFQIPYSLTFKTDTLNIFFTLFLGIIVLLIDDKFKNNYKYFDIKNAIIFLLIVLSQIMNMDYGYYGIITILLYKKYRDNFKKLIIGFIFLNISISFFNNIQFISLFSLLIIKTYNNKLGITNKFVKYGFYFFYPIHIVLMYYIKLIT